MQESRGEQRQAAQDEERPGERYQVGGVGCGEGAPKQPVQRAVQTEREREVRAPDREAEEAARQRAGAREPAAEQAVDQRDADGGLARDAV